MNEKVMKVTVLQPASATLAITAALTAGWMGFVRNMFGIRKPNAARTITLRVIAAGIAAHDIWSSYELGLGARLAMRMTLDWWSFEESVAGFFIHCVAVAGLAIAATYCGLKLPQDPKSARGPVHVAASAEPAHASPR
jgi:hypothetical protein